MLTNTLIELFTRDLNKLKTELNLYTNEADLWLVDKEISNSAGNLCLHIIGNINHFIGATIGNTGYIRKREEEFSLKNVSKEVLLNQIDETIMMINQTLSKLNQSDLNTNFPLEVFKKPMTTEFFLVHLTTHLSYHLGQINYHRRLLN